MSKLIVLISGLFFMATSVFAAEAADFANKKGNGFYKKDNTQTQTPHTIEIFAGGTKGRYCIKTQGGSTCGTLTLDYSGEFGTIQGIWTFGQQKGTFVWNFADASNFTGSFKFNNNLQPDPDNIFFPSDGVWNGSLK